MPLTSTEGSFKNMISQDLSRWLSQKVVVGAVHCAAECLLPENQRWGETEREKDGWCLNNR